MKDFSSRWLLALGALSLAAGCAQTRIPAVQPPASQQNLNEPQSAMINQPCAVPTDAGASPISEMDITVGGEDVLPLLTDACGRRTGIDGQRRRVEDVHNSTYTEDQIQNVLDPSQPSGVGRSITVEQPLEGEFTLRLLGNSSGPYEVNVRVFDSNGNREPAMVSRGELSKNEGVTFRLVLKAGNSSLAAMH